jgi:hypothetical protein
LGVDQFVKSQEVDRKYGGLSLFNNTYDKLA